MRRTSSGKCCGGDDGGYDFSLWLTLWLFLLQNNYYLLRAKRRMLRMHNKEINLSRLDRSFFVVFPRRAYAVCAPQSDMNASSFNAFDWIFAIINCADDELSGQLQRKMTAATRRFSHGSDVKFTFEVRCCEAVTQLTANEFREFI